MDDVESEGASSARGTSRSRLREFTCKDCQREVEGLEAEVAAAKTNGVSRNKQKKLRAELRKRQEKAQYNEYWAENVIERGGTRSDRCKDHRLKHRQNIQGMAVAYIDLETVGEVADRSNPTGPLGGLGPLPDKHEIVEGTTYELEKVKVGMTDDHIVEMVDKLRDKRVLILKAGTGTGKSTFAPYRLMDPPAESIANAPPNSDFLKLTDLGQIVVTEPRVQAAVGVATFVGGIMSGVGEEILKNGEKEIVGGVGPGCPVGYQVSGDRNHDEACQLVYVTDGTMINWLREGRLSRIGTVIVDEAHERSTNIDFIMGFLKRELDRYPHLRVIVTSATFNTDFYQEYFGGPDVANVMDIPAAKSFGYGMPLFPALDSPADGEEDVLERWDDSALPLSSNSDDVEKFIRRHWQENGPKLEEEDVVDKDDVEWQEDVWETTRALIDLRFDGKIDIDNWKNDMPGTIASFVVELAQGLDDAGIYGDILGFLPTKKTIEPACEEIERALGLEYEGHVFPLISSLDKSRQKDALKKRRKGDPRKIVISTNLAETSLTVEGVRFVVDTGLIAQSEWDPQLAQGGIPTKPHSRAGIRQRWGRVGRKGPGWVFPLYTKGQFLELPEDTPPGSARQNLESLVMTAKMGGVDDIEGFDWPAAFNPTTTELDETAIAARETFNREIVRADASLQSGGALDENGDPTAFGKELAHFSGLGSTASALAIMYADRLACVPEVATILALLEDKRLVGPEALLRDDRAWPEEWRLEAAQRHRALADLSEDEAHLVLLIMAAWERSDPDAAPWETSNKKEAWSRQWWITNEVLVGAAEMRQEVLGSLSPAMKEEVKRPVEVALLDRARGVISRAVASHRYTATEEGFTSRSATARGQTPAEGTGSGTDADLGAPSPEPLLAELEFDRAALFSEAPQDVIALRRRESRDDNRISNLVGHQAWAISDDPDQQATGVVDAMQMVLAAAEGAPPMPERAHALALLGSWPVGLRIEATVILDHSSGHLVLADVTGQTRRPFACPTTDEVEGKSRRRRRRRSGEGDNDGDVGDMVADLGLLDGAKGFADEDQNRSRAFARADRAVASAATCGICFNCIAGREENCDGLEDAPKGKGENPVQKWQNAVRREGAEVALSVLVTRAADHGWYEVVGYTKEGDGWSVTLAPDWRPAGGTANPAQHRNIDAGETVQVTVGPSTRHHGGTVRIFHRTDGHGRFVLSEASSYKGKVQEERGEIAASLDRGSRGLIEALVEDTERSITATVVPARVEGCYTITLLELLHQHLTKGAKEFHILDKADRTSSRIGLHPAVLTSEPNEFGYGTAALLHQDGRLGLRHFFDFNVTPRSQQPRPDDSGGPEQEETTTAPAPERLALDAPILLNLVKDNAILDVEGFLLSDLDEIQKDSARSLSLKLPGKKRGRKGHRDADELDPDATAPPGAKLISSSDKPLSRHNAIALVELDESHEWRNEVWAFWARSHHLQVDAEYGYIRGSSTEVIEREATVEIDSGSPLERQKAGIRNLAERIREGTVVNVTVTETKDRVVFVSLGQGLEGRIPISELAWGFTDHVADEARAGESLRAVVTKIDLDRGEVALSVKALLPKPYDLYKASNSIGSQVTATVRNITDSHAYVDLSDAVDGVVFIRELAHGRVNHPSDIVVEGEVITVQIKGFNDERDQVELSVKALLPKPLEAFKSHHRAGSRVVGVVRNVTKNHVYVELEHGAEGVIFVGDLAHGRTNDARAVSKQGASVTAQVKGFNDERGQVELSIKALLPKPYDAFKAGHHIGEDVDGTVRKVTKSHAYVELGDGVDGAIFKRELTHGNVDDAQDHVREGEKVRARIKGFNDERDQVELSKKALLPEPYPAFKASHSIGQAVQGVVNGWNKSFAYVDLAGGVKGAIHVSQLASHRVGSPEEVVSKGQSVTAVVKGFDDSRKQVEISLTMAVRSAAPPRRNLAPPIAPQAPARSVASRPPAPTSARRAPTPKRTATAEGSSVAEACANAAASLGLTPAQVLSRTVRAEKRGFFGGVKQTAIVEVTER